ncbi:MAG: hypothetical protein ACREGA_01910 [Candidatus Saccharimonadales bacterium]
MQTLADSTRPNIRVKTPVKNFIYVIIKQSVNDSVTHRGNRQVAALLFVQYHTLITAVAIAFICQLGRKLGDIVLQIVRERIYR